MFYHGRIDDSKRVFLFGVDTGWGWGGGNVVNSPKICGDNVSGAHIEIGRFTYTFSLECGKLFHPLYVNNPYMVMLLISSDILHFIWKMSKTQGSIPGIEMTYQLLCNKFLNHQLSVYINKSAKSSHNPKKVAGPKSFNLFFMFEFVEAACQQV